MAKTITIRQHGDVVYFLNKDGFQKGTIKRVLVVSEQYDALSIKYFVTCPKYASDYMGDELKREQLFETRKAMIDFYSKQAEDI